jgi:hypothetical protein
MRTAFYHARKMNALCITANQARMAEMGQSRRFGDVPPISALPPKADIHQKGRHVAKVPIADMLYALVRRIDGEGMPSEAMPMV